MLSLIASPLLAEDRSAACQSALRQLEERVTAELDRSKLSGVSVALIDGDKVYYARGFGHADEQQKTPATETTLYRAGSISKLFTAVAAMRLAEQKWFDIDAPIETHLPTFRVVNPFPESPPITLRRLMCHRSGMVRESPVGGYFDERPVTIDDVVTSLADCVLPTAPDAKMRYSNVGPTIVGRAIEQVSGKTFEDYLQTQVFDVAEMADSSWRLKPGQQKLMATGYMSVAQPDGTFRRIPAPRFELGTAPAGNLYTNVSDLGRFVTFLINEGRVGERVLLEPASLAEMYRPQAPGATRTFGLGFSLGKFREHDTVAHMGAVYGFTSSLVAVPSLKVGAVVLCNEDLSIGPVQRLMNAALETAVACRSDMAESSATHPPAASETPDAAASQTTGLKAFAGQYEAISYWAEVELRDHGLRLVISGQTLDLTRTGELTFQANGRLFFNAPITFERDSNGRITGFTALNQKFSRIDPANTPEAPADWSKFTGSYGPDFIPLIISIRDGHLYAMTENEFDYRMTPVARNVFRFPPGMYDEEYLTFQVDAEGNVPAVMMTTFELKRAAAPGSKQP